MPSNRRRWRIAGLAAVASLAVACQSVVTPAPSPAGTTPVPSPEERSAWIPVRPPSAIEEAADTLPPTCAECQPDAPTTLSGIAAGPAGLVTVGSMLQDFHGLAWHSSDGVSWVPDPPFSAGTELVAVAADPRRYVAVGVDGRGGSAWSSTDGAAWREAPHGAFDVAGPFRIAAVTAWSGGFAAAGYEGTEFGHAVAAFWVSPDGVAWERAADGPAFGDARAFGIAADAHGLVAVGVSGAADAPGPGVAWTSPDGRRWSRAPGAPAFDGARLRAVAAIPGVGLVATGEDPARASAVVLVSSDGTTWTRAPATPALGVPGAEIRVDAVAAGGAGIVAIGSASAVAGDQSADATVWTSSDGTSWRREPPAVEFIASELAAVVPWRGRLVAAGYSGGPDDLAATVWISPAGWARP